jgi:hypothetical protein
MCGHKTLQLGRCDNSICPHMKASPVADSASFTSLLLLFSTLRREIGPRSNTGRDLMSPLGSQLLTQSGHVAISAYYNLRGNASNPDVMLEDVGRLNGLVI